jgi:hypothetical protein
MTADFLMAGQLEQTISLDVSGNAGARLFAAQASPGRYFDSVTLSADVDWAAGQFRYAPAGQAAPEPGPCELLPVGILLFWRLREHTTQNSRKRDLL